MTRLGERIASARARAGLNKNQLARAVGTSWQHVDHWESDRTAPSSASLKRLASVLGVSLAWLLGDLDGRDEHLDAPSTNEALATFLRTYAPHDVTAEEIVWLSSAPVDPALATPGHYLDLLHGLRAPRLADHRVPHGTPPAGDHRVPRSAPPAAAPRVRTGRRAKVTLDGTSKKRSAR